MITEKRELKNVPLADLIPYARNPRKNDPAVQRIAASLKEYGLVKNSIVVDEDMVLITGHTTTKAMQALKWQTAPEVTQAFGLTEAQKKAYRIADNRLGELAEWDEELLALEIEDLKDLDFDLDLSGFDEKEIEKITGAGKEVHDDDFEPPAEVQTDIQRGDLFTLGRHRLLCGDSTSAEDVGRLMDGKKADMVFTDPPYGVDYIAMRGGEKITNDSTAGEAYRAMASALGSLPTGVAFVCCSWRSLPITMDAMLDAGLKPKACIVWDKERGVQNLDKYYKQHEFVLYAGPYGGEKTVDGDVWKIPRDFDPDHPTPKPVALPARAINTASSEGQLVADPFLGSGTTLVACEQLGRTCYGMEISPQYCQVIIDRWEKLTGQKAERVNGQD